jgi:hypothetical protein
MAVDTYTPKPWHDDPTTDTPVNAAALMDAEARVTAWADRIGLKGTGSPEGVVTADPGQAYLRKDGGAGRTLYLKVTGVGTNTGWIAVEEATGELQRAELATGAPTAGTTQTDVAGLAVTFVAPTRPVMLEFWAYSFAQATSTGQPSAYITDAANAQQAQGAVNSTAAGGLSCSVNARVPLTTLVAGNTYTFKIRIATTAGTCQLVVGSSPNWKAFLRAVTI